MLEPPKQCKLEGGNDETYNTTFKQNITIFTMEHTSKMKQKIATNQK
jgi:hypothetical protein